MLDAVTRQYGILHLLFHPAHIDKPGVADSIKNAVALGRENGLEWWTGREIADWETARRSAKWTATEDGFRLAADTALAGATILFLAAEGTTAVVEGQPATKTIERWGFKFQTVTRGLTGGETLRITVENN